MENRKQNTTASGGIGATGLLGIAFIVLKLCGVIDWSWWWVLSPYWGALAIVLAGAAFVMLGALIGALRNKKK